MAVAVLSGEEKTGMLFSSKIADAVLDGKKRFEERMQADTDKETQSVDVEVKDDMESDLPESIETKNGIAGFDEEP